MNHWKIVKSIWQKVEAKNPVGKIRGMFSKTPSGFSLRCLPEAQLSGQHSTGGSTGFRMVSRDYNTVCSQKFAQNVRFLNFNTDVERYNAWQSYLTKFARFCICMDESTKLAPYMNNYTQPWDDQRFYEYFGLNKIEIQLIETVIK